MKDFRHFATLESNQTALKQETYDDPIKQYGDLVSQLNCPKTIFVGHGSSL